MKKRLKEMVPRLIVAQTLMLAAITGLTIGGACQKIHMHVK